MGDLECLCGVHGDKFEEESKYQFRVVELTCRALGTNQNSAPHINRRESQRETPLSVARVGLPHSTNSPQKRPWTNPVVSIPLVVSTPHESKRTHPPPPLDVPHFSPRLTSSEMPSFPVAPRGERFWGVVPRLPAKVFATKQKIRNGDFDGE